MSALMQGLEKVLFSVGAMLLEIRDGAGRNGHWEGTQFKAEADVQAHGMLSSGLKDLYGEVPVLSEEDPASLSGERPEAYWLIDPLDGTASYAGGYDGFVTQAALVESGTPVLGGVYAPRTGEMFLADTKSGSFLNGAPLPRRTKAEPWILVDNYPEPRGIAGEIMGGLSMEGYLESGSLGLKICRVAAGQAALFVKDVTIRDWDIAPAQVILEQAGGILVMPDGRPFPYSGSWDREGLVAAATLEAGERCIHWLKARTAK